MDVFLGNPAGRLYRFLEHCAQEESEDSILNGVGRYLGMSAKAITPTRVLSTIAPLFELPGNAIGRLRVLPDRAEHIEDYEPALMAASAALGCLAQANAKMAVMQRTYNAGDVRALRACSRVLGKEPRSAVATDDQLDEIRVRALELVDAIRNSDTLPTEVSQTLLGYAYDALEGVDYYRVGGTDALVKSSDQLRGQAFRDPGFLTAAASEKKIWPAIVRFSEALLVVSVLTHTPLAIGEDVQQFQAALNALPPTVLVAPAPHEPQE